MYIITGASRGIGRYLLEELVKREETVFGTYNNSIPIDYKDNYFNVDITSIESIKEFFNQIYSKLDKIVLLNCAGNNYNSFAHKVNLEKWNKVINTNLIGTFNTIFTFLPIMREQNYGRIINFSSIVAQIGIPGTSAYAASKAGIWGLTKTLAVENGKKNITTNTLNLGYFDIGMISEVSEDYINVIKSRIPNNQLGDPNNILKTIDYIVNTEYLNGAIIDINGGLN